VTSLPERVSEVEALSGLLVDDPSGLTPEQRLALTSACERGMVLLLTLGRRASAPPIGATFEPFVVGATTYGVSPAKGLDHAAFDERLTSVVETTDDLAPKGRTTLAENQTKPFETLLRWSDGAPFLLRRDLGKGEVWLLTASLRTDESDLPLRPGFLALLDAFVDDSKRHGNRLSGEVGVPWLIHGAGSVKVEGPRGPVTPVQEGDAWSVTPERIGAYRLTIDGANETRYATPVARELDLVPRKVVLSPKGQAQVANVSRTDVTWVVALSLLVVGFVEVALRIRFLRHKTEERAA
jgi:hypothetical protein